MGHFFFQDDEMCPDFGGCILGDLNIKFFSREETDDKETEPRNQCQKKNKIKEKKKKEEEEKGGNFLYTLERFPLVRRQ